MSMMPENRSRRLHSLFRRFGIPGTQELEPLAEEKLEKQKPGPLDAVLPEEALRPNAESRRARPKRAR